MTKFTLILTVEANMVDISTKLNTTPRGEQALVTMSQDTLSMIVG